MGFWRQGGIKTLLALALAAFPVLLHAAGAEGERTPEDRLLERHRPFYFAYGNPLSKLQISFKTPIVRHWPVYFGYTQMMFWALREESKPFRDLTYNPELFYRWDLKNEDMIVRSVDFGVWAHDSNGKAGPDSRSYDSHYMRVNFQKDGARWQTRFSLQLAYLDQIEKENGDIRQFIGPASFTIQFIQMFDAWIDKSEIVLWVQPGGPYADRWSRGGYQLSWAFRLGGIHLVPAFYLQYYRGYGETLLNYDQPVNQFRVGLMF